MLYERQTLWIDERVTDIKSDFNEHERYLHDFGRTDKNQQGVRVTKCILNVI